MSWLFPSGGQNIGASASASVLPMNVEGWFSLGLTGLISLLSKSLSKSLLQHHNLKASVLWRSAFFMVQLSHPYMTTEKPIVLTRWAFVSKVITLLFNMLSRFAIAFPKSTPLLVSHPALVYIVLNIYQFIVSSSSYSNVCAGMLLCSLPYPQNVQLSLEQYLLLIWVHDLKSQILCHQIISLSILWFCETSSVCITTRLHMLHISAFFDLGIHVQKLHNLERCIERRREKPKTIFYYSV